MSGRAGVGQAREPRCFSFEFAAATACWRRVFSPPAVSPALSSVLER
jgi:hypothetical protein